MSRYRPPRPRSSPYITQSGYDRLQSELSYLWKEKRPEVTAKVSEAAAMGDRSENAEYIYGKRQLREIDGRIQFLSRRLDELVIIDRKPGNAQAIYFGAWVSVEDESGEEKTFRIVGADEFDADPCYISIDAPLARALIGKHIDEEVVLLEQRNEGVPRILKPGEARQAYRYTVVDIRYGSATDLRR